MMFNTEQATPIMHEYFQTCVAMARGEATIDGKPDGKPMPRSKRYIASYADLSIKLGVSKADLMATESGNDKEREFFNDMQLRFEVAVDAEYNAKMIEKSTYEDLKAGFKKSGDTGEKTIVLQFPDFNAPDDWEDYKEFKKLFEDNGLTWIKAMQVMRKALGVP
jgi:hypothetical protein